MSDAHQMYYNYRGTDWGLAARRRFFTLAAECDAIGGRHRAVRERLTTASAALRRAEDHLADLERHLGISHGEDASTKKAIEITAAEVRALGETRAQLAEQLAEISTEASAPVQLRNEARDVLLKLQILSPNEA